MELLLGNFDEVLNCVECENIDFKKIYLTKSFIKKFYKEDIFNMSELIEEDIEINEIKYIEIKDILKKLLNIPESENSEYNSLFSSLLNTKFDIYIIFKNFSKKINFVDYQKLRNVLHKNIIKTLNFSKEDFHIEIKKSEDIVKKIYILKNKETLQIFSSFGFNDEKNFLDFYKCGEAIITIDEKFSKINNKQKYANFRDGSGSIKKFELQEQSSVVTNQDLLKIDEKIKNLDTGIWELTMLKSEEILIENFFSLYEEDFCKKFSSNNLFLSKQNLEGKIEISEEKFILCDTEEKFFNALNDGNDKILLFNELIFSPELLYLIHKKNISYLFLTNLKSYEIEKGTIDFSNLDFLPITNNNNNLNNENNINNNMEIPNTTNTKSGALNFLLQHALEKQEKEKQKEKEKIENENVSSEEKNIYNNVSNEEPLKIPEETTNNQNIPQSSFDFLNEESKEIPIEKENIVQTETQVNTNFQNLKSNILTSQNVNSNNYFLDVDSINNVDNCEKIFYFTSNKQNIVKNCKNFYYVIPYVHGQAISEEDYLMMNSPSNFFEYDELNSKKINIFLNLENFEKSIWENFILNSKIKFKSVSISISKFNLDILKNILFKVSNIHIKDLENEFEYNQINEKIIQYKIDGILNEFK